MHLNPQAAVVTAAVLGVAGCSGSDEPGPTSDAGPAAALEPAAAALDQTPGVQFTLEGENLPDSGTVIIGTTGLAAYPASFEGDIRVSTSRTVRHHRGGVRGRPAVGEAAPLTEDFAPVDAASLGFSDPRPAARP